MVYDQVSVHTKPFQSEDKILVNKDDKQNSSEYTAFNK